MNSDMLFVANMLLSCGVPIWLLNRPMGSARGDRDDRRRRPSPAPVTPPAPEPVMAGPRKLPDCLVPRPLPRIEETEPVRELEPV
jgi:hypothetical protein